MNFESIDVLTLEEVEKTYSDIIDSNTVELLSYPYCYCASCGYSWYCYNAGPASSSTYWLCTCRNTSYSTYIYNGAGSCPSPSC